MTTEQALIEIRKIRYSFSHKLLSVDMALKKVSDILDIIEKNELESVISFRSTRDDYYIHRHHYQKAANIVSKEAWILTSIEYVIRDLETDLLGNYFTKAILSGKKFSRGETIEGLEDFKQTAIIDSISITKWLNLISEVAKQIFGNASNEFQKSINLVLEHNEKIEEAGTDKDVQSIDSGYRMKGLLLIDSFIKTVRLRGKQHSSEKPKTTDEETSKNTKEIKEEIKRIDMKETQPDNIYKKLFYGLLAVVLVLLGGAYKFGWDNGYSRYDNDKNVLNKENEDLKKDIIEKNDSLAHYHYQLEKMVTTNETLLEMMKKKK